MYLKYIALFFLLFFVGCTSVGTLNNEVREKERQISAITEKKLSLAAAAAASTQDFLKENNIEEALKTNEYVIFSLPSPKIDHVLQWRQISERILLGDLSEYKKAINKLAELQNSIAEKESEIEALKEKIAILQERQIKRLQERLDALQARRDLESNLMWMFAIAAIACIIAGALLFRRMGGAATNLLIAGAGFGFAAYLITTSWFGYVAAGVAICIAIGVIYMIFGRLRPERTLKKVVSGIERHRKKDPKEVEHLELDLAAEMDKSDKKYIDKKKHELKY